MRLGSSNISLTLCAVALLRLTWVVTAADAEVSMVSMVLVEIDRQEYKQYEEVKVTVTNNLDTSITTYDQQTFCGIIGLEQKTGEKWKEVRNCFSGAPRRDVMLEPYSKTLVKLPGLSTGIYRAVFTFSVGEIFDIGRSYVSYSSRFTVR